MKNAFIIFCLTFLLIQACSVSKNQRQAILPGYYNEALWKMRKDSLPVDFLLAPTFTVSEEELEIVEHIEGLKKSFTPATIDSLRLRQSLHERQLTIRPELRNLSTASKSTVQLFFSEVYKGVFFIELFKWPKRRLIRYDEISGFGQSRVYTFRINEDGSVLLLAYSLIHHN